MGLARLSELARHWGSSGNLSIRKAHTIRILIARKPEKTRL